MRALYYAVGPETESELVPQYQKYTEPISYTEGMLYRFYAEDAAGNRSTPVVTNMKTAEEPYRIAGNACPVSGRDGSAYDKG